MDPHALINIRGAIESPQYRGIEYLIYFLPYKMTFSTQILHIRAVEM